MVRKMAFSLNRELLMDKFAHATVNAAGAGENVAQHKIQSPPARRGRLSWRGFFNSESNNQTRSMPFLRPLRNGDDDLFIWHGGAIACRKNTRYVRMPFGIDHDFTEAA